ncbi:MAG: helix-turn-helix domain-containing protein [Candidatus Thiodiazotropha sp.]
MQRSSFADMPCSVARTLDTVGEWWTLLILRDIFYGVRRFEALRNHLGISRKVLTSRLERLTDDAILMKTPYQETSTRYEYRLTEKGLDLLPVLLMLMNWGDKWLAEEDAVPVVFVHRDCGQETTPKVVCSCCGGELNARNIYPKAGPGAPAEEVVKLRAASVNPRLFLEE